MMEGLPPETRPDYLDSRWLDFEGIKPVEGDPSTQAQFTATHTCLATITSYVADTVDPWFTATAQDVQDVHSQFIEWSQRYNRTSRETGEGMLTTDISLPNLLALSTRRLYALEEFGGEGREEYPLFLHVHNLIRTAVETHEDDGK